MTRTIWTVRDDNGSSHQIVEKLLRFSLKSCGRGGFLTISKGRNLRTLGLWQMQYRHVTSLSRDGITLVAITKDTLAAINEGTCWSGPNPLVGELLDEFTEALKVTPGPVIVDIRDTRLIDKASLSALFQLVRLVAKHDKRGFICCSSEVKNVLDVCKVDTICPTTSNLDEAVTALAAEQ
jgi:anti-anti-sigma regulatory factor